jgi:hypothetical protein
MGAGSDFEVAKQNNFGFRSPAFGTAHYFAKQYVGIAAAPRTAV